MSITFHKLCNSFPEMTEPEFAELCASIETSGQREPIVLFGTEILDGKHRYKACQKLGVRPWTRHWDVRKDGQSLVQFVLDRNLNRRNLSPSERASVAVALHAALKKDMAENKVGRLPTLEMLAKRAGVSKRTMSRASKLSKTNPEAFEKVQAGETTLHAALEEPKPEPENDHRDMMADGLAIIHGDIFAATVRNGDVLPGPDLAAFSGMTESEQRGIFPLVCRGWKPKLALKFWRGEFADSDTIRDLINFAEYGGGVASLVVGGYRIELTEENWKSANWRVRKERLWTITKKN